MGRPTCKIFGYALILLLQFLLAAGQLTGEQFEPQVTASCDANTMTIVVRTRQPFSGVVHAKDLRTDVCSQQGSSSTETQMKVNLLARTGDPDYCGVVVNNRTDERSMPIAVRFHRTLELAEDKLFVITCGKPGFRNSRDERSDVTLALLDRGRRAKEVIYSRPYTLQVQLSQPDDAFDVSVRDCFSFAGENTRVHLIDSEGCAERRAVITRFVYNKTAGVATANISSMYRFPDTNQVNIQCDVIICKVSCAPVVCAGDGPVAKSRALDNAVDVGNDARLLAATSVMVVEPGQSVSVEPLTDCDGFHPAWLLYLCIAFGLLFLIMMIINCFLCTAMTCSCSKTEVVEKDPSLEDYDPYRSWHGSQYSLNGKSNHGYDHGALTMNSAQSVSTTNSDHYAMVHSRPVSRYSESRSHRSHRSHPRNNRIDYGEPQYREYGAPARY